MRELGTLHRDSLSYLLVKLRGNDSRLRRTCTSPVKSPTFPATSFPALMRWQSEVIRTKEFPMTTSSPNITVKTALFGREGRRRNAPSLTSIVDNPSTSEPPSAKLPETPHQYCIYAFATQKPQLPHFRPITKPRRDTFALGVRHLRQITDRHIARSNGFIDFLRVSDDLLIAFQHHAFGRLDESRERWLRCVTCDAARVDDCPDLCKGNASCRSCA